ncbi:hypothetical protein ACFX2F_034895 [Malus domestica]
MTKKGKGTALLLAQKSKRHRPPNLESQTPNRITFLKIEEAPLSESKEPLPIGLLSQKSKRHRSPNLESQIPNMIACSKIEEASLSELRELDFLDKDCLQSLHATSSFQIPHTTFSKCSDKVKTREACSSHYIATTKKGNGIALLLVVRETPIYVDLHHPHPSKPANKKKCSTFLHIREGTLSKVSRNTQLLFLPIIPLQTSHTRTRVFHIIRVKSKSIPYHAFSLSFPLALFLLARQGEIK